MKEKYFGIGLVVLGIFFLNPFFSITGNVVGERVGEFVASIIGLIFLVIGLGLMIMSESEMKISRKDLTSAFKSFDGKFSGKQKKLIKNMNLKLGKKGGDYQLTDFRGRYITLPGNPRDPRSGRNIAAKLYKFVSEQ